LGQKPELRTSGGGLSISKLRIATSDRRKGSDGQWNDMTEWHSVVVFGSQAENCAKFLDKGRQVYIEGRLQTNKWQDKEGKDRWTTEIIANQVKFLSNKSSGGDSSYQGNSSSGSSNSNNQSNNFSNPSDEIPF
jgi:single-strand DNA-binding protein